MAIRIDPELPNGVLDLAVPEPVRQFRTSTEVSIHGHVNSLNICVRPILMTAALW